jgi:hypothetical protein
MGYYDGDIGDDTSGLAREALLLFQSDHGLDPTGRLDEQTASKIGERYGQ